MPNYIRLNGVKTRETCPVCSEPGILVEHGHDEYGACHLSHCPECGESISIVGYHCPNCDGRSEHGARSER